MRLIGAQKFDPILPGNKEFLQVGVSRYLARKTGVTISSVAWSSVPAGVTFSSQSEDANSSQVLATIPSSAATEYTIKCKFTFSDGAIRTVEAPLRTEK